MNDVSHDFNFQREIIYVTHITPLKAQIWFKMFLCSLGIQLANYIRNLNN